MNQVNMEMELFQCSMTKFQSAVATAAALRMNNPLKTAMVPRFKNIMVEMPPACGKTRVAIGIVLSLAKYNHSTELTVVVIHPTSLLED